MCFIDLRSDTVTQPTDEMRKAMYEAEIGDDVYDEDPTVKKLENMAAEILGKEAGLFVPSGTFGNQVSIFTHCKKGDEVILGDDCHIVQHEAGAAAIIAGVQLRTINSNKGALPPDEVEKKIRKIEDILKKIRNIADKYDIPIHLDGARIFNAATALQVEPIEIAQYADSVSFCLSKGLCAPVGSVVVGSKNFIGNAKKNRKIMGGGMRQAGILAAAGITALEKMRFRLYEDHENAKYLAEKLNDFDFIDILEKVDINMVFFRINKEFKDEDFILFMKDNGIKINPPEDGVYRFVTHYWIKKSDIDKAMETMEKFFI
ncbi:MAG: threonine aldolase [Marinitoga sp. 4572_148]|nr:MAG: threonine aldolase [Marinitoga sp. 4572_148]